MRKIKSHVRNKDPPSEGFSSEDLEARLNQVPNLDTDLMEFLVISGLDNYWEPLYKKENEGLRLKVKEKYKNRRNTLSPYDKMMETKVVTALTQGYWNKEYKTIGEMSRPL